MGTTCSLNEIVKLSHCSSSGSGSGSGSSKYKRNPVFFFYSVYALSFCNDDSTYQVIHSDLTQQDGRERKTADVL